MSAPKSEIDRLLNLIYEYEKVNLDQINQIETLKQTHDACNRKNIELEKTRKQLSKTVMSLEGKIKFDKFASEGLRKKYNVLEVVVRDLKYDKEQLGIERSQYKSQIELLEKNLNSNRADKLKLMHENALLKKSNERLISNEDGAQSELRTSHQKLLDRLQEFEDVLIKSENQKALIAAQSEEIVLLSNELYDLKVKLNHSHSVIVDQDTMASEYNKTIDILQHEVSRLRKELMSVSINASSTSLVMNSSISSFTVKSAAVTDRCNRISTSIVSNANSTANTATGRNTAYPLKLRPQTMMGLSRDRNNNSINTEQKDHHGILNMKTNNKIETNGNTISNSNTDKKELLVSASKQLLPSQNQQKQKQQYHYKDIPIIHAGSRYLPTMSVSTTDTLPLAPVGMSPGNIRSEILQQCEDVVTAFTNNNNVRNNSGHDHISYYQIGKNGDITNNNLYNNSCCNDADDNVVDYNKNNRNILNGTTSPTSLTYQSSNAIYSHNNSSGSSVLLAAATAYRPQTTSLSSQTTGKSLSATSPISLPRLSHNNSIDIDNNNNQLQQLSISESTVSSSSASSALQQHHKQLLKYDKNNQKYANCASVPLAVTALQSNAAAITKPRSQQQHTQYHDGNDNNDSVNLSLYQHSIGNISNNNSDETHNNGNNLLNEALSCLQSSSLESKNIKQILHNETRAVKTADQARRKKTLFVGSGLGLRHNEKLEAELRNINKGSTKQLLRKVLKDRLED